jgi:hypothetical protein
MTNEMMRLCTLLEKLGCRYSKRLLVKAASTELSERKSRRCAGVRLNYRAHWKELRCIRIEVDGRDLCRGNVSAEFPIPEAISRTLSLGRIYRWKKRTRHISSLRPRSKLENRLR